MEIQNPLDKFGKFLVENLRDKGIGFAQNLLNSHSKSSDLKNIQAGLQTLNEKQKKTFRQAITKTVDNAIHDFLFAIQEHANFDNSIQIIVDGRNVVQLSDGIHGEAYTDEGWYAKFSNYGIPDF